MNTPTVSGPGKSDREGISIIELAEMFPTEESAVAWFETIYWPTGRVCGHCGSTNTGEVPNAKPMPYWCPDCRSYFSVRTGTTLQHSRLPLRKWAFAVYMYVTNLKGVSSMKLHRDLKVTQKTAWFMLHRLRESWKQVAGDYDGPVEVDESYIGGKRKNMSNAKRKELKDTGRGPVGKTAVVGAKDRVSNKVSARVVESTNADTLQGFVREHAAPSAEVFTDDAGAYHGIPNPHPTVKHSVSEYVRGKVHTNGIESFWSMLKRGHMGTFHHFSKKHLQRYVDEFAGRHGVRELDTIDQMRNVVAAMVGNRLMYEESIKG